MKLIEQNPFRMLGITVNAGARELAGNLGKKRLLDIGKDVSFPLDLISFFTPINRTSAAMDAANAAINQPQDKVRHALFWFAKPSDSMGGIAYNHLLDGDVDKASDLFGKSKSWESKLCLSVIELQNGRTSESVSIVANEIIGSDANRNELLDAIAGQTFRIDRQGLFDLYFGALANEVDMSALLYASVPSDVADLIKQKSVGKPIADIEAALNKAKAVDDEDYLAQLNAGRQLWKDTRKPLQQLKQTLGENDLQYSRLADKVANQILQCSINYHNAIDNSTDEPVSVAVVDKCIEMAECAENLCVGRITKERIEKNLEILREKKKRMPPAEVEKEVTAIMSALRTFVEAPDKIEYSVALLNTTKPYLQSIKNKLGSTNDFYLNLSTQVVNNALHNLIEEVNNAQKEKRVSAYGDPRLEILESPSSAIDELHRLRRIQKAVSDAWECTKIMDLFDMTSEFRSNRFAPNRESLRKMHSQITEVFSRIGNNYPSTGGRSSGSSDGCYIATMVYGDYNHPQVMVLRGFRDDVLQQNPIGRAFVRFYYRYSPTWVEHLKDKKYINNIIRNILDKFIKIYRHEK